MDASDEHAALIRSASDLLGDLHAFRSHYVYGRVANAQHDEFAERALSLQIYLSSALRLSLANKYPPTYAVVRAALEHHLVDRLLFLGRRYKIVFTGVKKPTFDRWYREWKAGDAGYETVVRLEWKDGNVVVVRSGLHLTGRGRSRSSPTLSNYYFLLQQFDPFVGRAAEQRHLAPGFTPLQHHIDHAQEQQATYGTNLRWDAIKSNLAYNRLASAEALRQFEVHYRFLSAFVHPVPPGYDLVYGRNRPSGAPRYNHYASELALLYINKIASEELKVLQRMAKRPPEDRAG